MSTEFPRMLWGFPIGAYGFPKNGVTSVRIEFCERSTELLIVYSTEFLEW